MIYRYAYVLDLQCRLYWWVMSRVDVAKDYIMGHNVRITLPCYSLVMRSFDDLFCNVARPAMDQIETGPTFVHSGILFCSY